MTRKFHSASYDDVDQVIRTRQRRRECFLKGMKRVRAKLQRKPGSRRAEPPVLGGLRLS